MKWLESRVLWGSLLILGGLIFLLENLGLFELGGLFWALLLALAGIFFVTMFAQNRGNWWALIPGFTLLSVALLVALDELAPSVSQWLGGSLVLGGIGLSFLAIYLVERQNWWALIPGGVMITLAVIAGLDEAMPGLGTGGIFFIGLGLTFTLLALLPGSQGQMRWAWIPAGILLVMGLLFLATAEKLAAYVWPLALILGGGYLILRTLLPRRR